jgi:hypothetical protein
MILSLAPWMAGHIPSRKVLSTTVLDKVCAAEKARVEGWLAEQVRPWIGSARCRHSTPRSVEARIQQQQTTLRTSEQCLPLTKA